MAYPCTVCGTLHSTIEAANDCKKLPVPKQEWATGSILTRENGDEIRLRSSHLVVAARYSNPRHEIRYGFRGFKGSSTRYVLQSSLLGAGWYLKK